MIKVVYFFKRRPEMSVEAIPGDDSRAAHHRAAAHSAARDRIPPSPPDQLLAGDSAIVS